MWAVIAQWNYTAIGRARRAGSGERYSFNPAVCRTWEIFLPNREIAFSRRS